MDEQQAEIQALKEEIQALKYALSFAKSVIQNYAMDIRNPPEYLGLKGLKVDLVAKGFCQGSIYLEAEEQIERMVARRG